MIVCSSPKGVQLFIRAMDDDSRQGNPDDLVDTLLINHNLSIGEVPPRQSYTGIYNFLTMDLTIKAVCAENFTGADCTECVSGYTGAFCDNRPHQPTEDTSEGEIPYSGKLSREKTFANGGE